MSDVTALRVMQHVLLIQFFTCFSASALYTAYGSPIALVSPSLFLRWPPGFHWLTASFWLVSQQPDICTGPWCWRAFNGVMGLVHVFLFLNVKDGPSRFRMASFYAVRHYFSWNCSSSSCFLCAWFWCLFSVCCFVFYVLHCLIDLQLHTHRYTVHTQRQIVCVVILTSASFGFGDVKLSAHDWCCDLLSSFSSCS